MIYHCRYYATNATNPSLRRMIAYTSRTAAQDDSTTLKIPIFLQYVTSNHDKSENVRLKPHGNAKKSDRPFTSTLPSILNQIQVSSILKIII